jgi:hypothetical protein
MLPSMTHFSFKDTRKPKIIFHENENKKSAG